MRISDEDRKMLELAAKAEGIAGPFIDYCGIGVGAERDGWICWNPLHNDGDALRLAVKLGMHIVVDNESGLVRVYCQSFAKPEEVYGGGEQADDPYSATRRAIVRAAAEIGKVMKCE